MINYETARSFIKNGDLISGQGTEWFSRMIRWWTGSEVSHVAIALWVKCPNEENDRLCVIESTDGGVRIVPLGSLVRYYGKVGGKTKWYKLKENSGINGNNIVTEAMKMWGYEYPGDYQFFVMMFGWLRRLRAFRGRSPDVNPDEFHCTEMVVTALINAGYPHNKLPVLTVPEDVINFPIYEKGIEISV